MNRAVTILSIALIYCGTVFGAGFASGQEIFRFFSAYGIGGITVSVFVGFLFSFFGWFICLRAKQFSLADGNSYFRFLFSPRPAAILSALCSAFLVVTFCIMIAGCGTLAQEQLSVRPIVGALVALFVCYFIVCRKVQGLAGLNAVITPFLFLGVTVFCVLILMHAENTGVAVQNQNSAFLSGKTILSGILYLSYNMVSAAAVLAPAANMAKTKKDAAFGGLLGGVLIAVPLILMSVCLVLFEDVNTYPLPFFTLVRGIHHQTAPFCALLLFGAMLTTAASAGVSVLAKVPEKGTARFALLLCILALLVSLIPFGILIRTMYTLFGFCGLFLLVGMAKTVRRK